MSKSLDRLNAALENLEGLIAKQSLLAKDNALLKKEIETLKQEHLTLKETSQEVINELNNAIQVIEEYFKKQNANNKTT